MSVVAPSLPVMSLETLIADPEVRLRGLTRAQYDALVGTGALDDERVELLEGAIIEMAPQGEGHVEAVLALNDYLVPRVQPPWRVRPQMPIAASDRSEPEPDIAVAERLGRGHPRTAALVVEVAQSTHRTDLVHKPPIYAAAGVAQYWVVDLITREVVVHRDPRADGYGDVQRLPWTTPLEVLGIPVDLAALLADV